MENIREIVNGKLLPQFNNKRVSIIGLVLSLNELSLEIKTIDGVTVPVTLEEPVIEELVGERVEVIGTVQDFSILCGEIIEFKSVEDDDDARVQFYKYYGECNTDYQPLYMMNDDEDEFSKDYDDDDDDEFSMDYVHDDEVSMDYVDDDDDYIYIDYKTFDTYSHNSLCELLNSLPRLWDIK